MTTLNDVLQHLREWHWFDEENLHFETGAIETSNGIIPVDEMVVGYLDFVNGGSYVMFYVYDGKLCYSQADNMIGWRAAESFKYTDEYEFTLQEPIDSYCYCQSSNAVWLKDDDMGIFTYIKVENLNDTILDNWFSHVFCARF